MCPSGPPVPLIVRIFDDGVWTSDWVHPLGLEVLCWVDDIVWNGSAFLTVGSCTGYGPQIPNTDFGLISADGLTWTRADPRERPLVAAPGLVTSAAEPATGVSSATRSLVRLGERLVTIEVDTNLAYPADVAAVRLGASDDGIAWAWPWRRVWQWL